MRKKLDSSKALKRTTFPVEAITLTLGQLQASAAYKQVHARVGDSIHWHCDFPLRNKKLCPFTVDEIAATTGYQTYPDVLITHIWEEGHYELSNGRGGSVPIVPGKPATRDDMIDELLENMDETHKDLTIALDRYGRETREVIAFLRKEN